MAGVYSQLLIHIVFAVKYRQALIAPRWEEKLHKYITGIVQQRGHKMLAINGMPDHIHIFIGMKPVESISEMVREIKKASTKYINEQLLCPRKFQWQGGYGVFSYHLSQCENVCRYIRNQKQHHGMVSFRQEVNNLLDEYGLEETQTLPFEYFEK